MRDNSPVHRPPDVASDVTVGLLEVGCSPRFKHPLVQLGGLDSWPLLRFHYSHAGLLLISDEGKRASE